MPLNLFKRAVVGQPLTGDQFDQNMTDIENSTASLEAADTSLDSRATSLESRTTTLETEVSNLQTASTAALLGATWDGAGIPITSGHDVYITAPKTGTITGVKVITQSGPGSCSIDIRKTTLANFPPQAGDTITASSPPTIVADTKYSDSALVGWTTLITAGDVVGFSLLSCSTFTWVHIDLVYA